MFRTTDWDDVLWTGAVVHDRSPDYIPDVVNELRRGILGWTSTWFDKIGFVLVAGIAKLTAC